MHSKPFLRKATKWAIQKVHKDLGLPVPEIDLQILECGISSMKEYLLLSLNPCRYNQAIDFVISHEIGHLYDSFYRPQPPTNISALYNFMTDERQRGSHEIVQSRGHEIEVVDYTQTT